MKLEHISMRRQVPLIPLQGKVERLRKSLDETQKYELLTTNQYLPQMELVLEILQIISDRADPPIGARVFSRYQRMEVL